MILDYSPKMRQLLSVARLPTSSVAMEIIVIEIFFVNVAAVSGSCRRKRGPPLVLSTYLFILCEVAPKSLLVVVHNSGIHSYTLFLFRCTLFNETLLTVHESKEAIGDSYGRMMLMMAFSCRLMRCSFRSHWTFFGSTCCVTVVCCTRRCGLVAPNTLLTKTSKPVHAELVFV